MSAIQACPDGRLTFPVSVHRGLLDIGFVTLLTNSNSFVFFSRKLKKIFSKLGVLVQQQLFHKTFADQWIFLLKNTFLILVAMPSEGICNIRESRTIRTEQHAIAGTISWIRFKKFSNVLVMTRRERYFRTFMGSPSPHDLKILRLSPYLRPIPSDLLILTTPTLNWGVWEGLPRYIAEYFHEFFEN